jgi:secreted trypsin-like serine protease
MRDCHWTSLNFFNETPDEKFTDGDVCIAAIKERYYRIHNHLQLGDIAIVFDQRGMAIHSATYIADGVFFHRCGSNSSAPWSLIKAENLMGVYLRGRGVRLMYYRRKNM